MQDVTLIQSPPRGRTAVDAVKPVRRAEPGTRANIRACGIAMAMAFILMAVFNSSEVRSVARDLPANAVTDRLVLYADRWHELMLALGPAHARPAVRALFDDLRAVRW